MLDFKIKELPNIKFSHTALLNYYNEVVQNYQHLKWTPAGIDTLNHKVGGVYSWAIQSNLKDPSKPCPPYDIKNDVDIHPNNDFKVPTELIFGFGKIVVEAFPEVRQTVISAHPPGTVIGEHIDNDEFVKIHIPIKANNNSFFVFGDEKYNLEEGKAYLINTTLPHGTTNEGDTDRIHLIFKFPIELVDTVLSTDWILDPSFIDFDLLEIKNLEFDFNELVDYYNTIKQDYQYLKWTMPDIPKTNLGGLYGFGILTNKDNPDDPTDPPGIRTDKKKFEPLIKPTKMLTGFAKKIYEKIPYLEELVITGHPANSGIPPHIDKDEHIRIHLPIFANDRSYFMINGNEYVLEPTKVYLVNTKRIHTTINSGNEDRIHLHFKIPIGKIDYFLKTGVKL